MRTRQVQAAKQDGIFVYLLLLTGFLLLLEISFFIQCNQTYLSDFTFVSSQLNIPSTILPGILFFIFAQLLIHLSYCLLVWAVTNLIAELLLFSSQNKLKLAIFLWFVGLVTILVANQYQFPNSKFAFLTNMVLSQRATKIVLFVLLLGCLFFIFLAMLSFLNKVMKKSIYYLFLLFTILSVFVWHTFNPAIPLVKDAATRDQPNIILVGVDSLRPDFLSYFGDENLTPFFDSFLSQSTVFSEAVTPLARTFPSWTSILSGQYPSRFGIRTNLANQSGVNFSTTMPAIFQRHGYEAIYATDETRFSNIDKNFGFDKVVTPPMGLNDFLLGSFNDFPLSNLLVNTVIGKWLFPYSYANRPVYFTYEPNSFLNLVRPALFKDRNKPVFLSIHFCLTHYPYLWASLPGEDFSIQERYGESVMRVDKQIRDFFDMLKQAQLLNHAVVVLLSDHGEALEFPGDRITEKELYFNVNKKAVVPKFYPPSVDDEGINQSAGHGTDVLGLSQYHTLLAFRLYGLEKQKTGVLSGVVSLLDIKPTIFSLLGMKDEVNKKSMDGISLAETIKTGKPFPREQSIFLESDYSTEAVRSIFPEVRKIVMEGVHLFKIDPATTRLLVKPEIFQMTLESKQYADISGNWMLALYPQSKTYRMPILVNLRTGEWTDDLSSPFAQQSPAAAMLKRMREFYGDELKNI